MDSQGLKFTLSVCSPAGLVARPESHEGGKRRGAPTPARHGARHQHGTGHDTGHGTGHGASTAQARHQHDTNP